MWNTQIFFFKQEYIELTQKTKFELTKVQVASSYLLPAEFCNIQSQNFRYIFSAVKDLRT
jgi:hypothetical protein